MKKNILALFLAVAGWVACEDTRLDNLSPDKVYLPKSGLNQEVAYDLGKSATASLWASKSGLNGTSCKVVFEVDEQALDAYNAANGTFYQLLPEQCYNLGEHMTFDITGEEQYARFCFTYDPAAIAERSGYETEVYALPLKMSAEGVNVNKDQNTAIFAFTIKEPLVGFSSGREVNLNLDPKGPAVVNAEMTAKVAYDNEKDIPLSLKLREDLVAVYNQEKNTDYPILPATAYSLVSGLKIAAGQDTATLICAIDREELKLGTYVLPVELVSTSIRVDEANQIAYLLVNYTYPELPNTDWSILDFSSQSGQPAEIPANIIDGNPATYWHTVYGAKTYPQYITVDLGKAVEIVQLQAWPRQNGNWTVGALAFEVSMDGTDWSEHTNYTDFEYYYKVVDERTTRTVVTYTLPEPKQARYVRVNLWGEGGHAVSLGELIVRGTGE